MRIDNKTKILNEISSLKNQIEDCTQKIILANVIIDAVNKDNQFCDKFKDEQIAMQIATISNTERKMHTLNLRADALEQTTEL